MTYALKELIDIPALQDLLDALHKVNSLPSALLEVDGNILTATTLQEICTKFHRDNPVTLKKCIESNTRLYINVGKSDGEVVYTYHLGLIDAAVPVIIEGRHLGSIFIGHLFLEPPDETEFIRQARQYGFDESDYLQALRNVPLCSKTQLENNLHFISSFVQVMARNGLQSREQQESRLRLRECRKKLKGILDTTGAGIILVSPHGEITYANRRMAEMFGIPLAEFIGTKYLDHLHESDRQESSACMETSSDRETASVETVRHYIRKDGTDFWGNLTGTRFAAADGSLGDQIIVISDITARIKATEERKIHEQQLQQARKLESLGVLAGGIAHDFNNLLAIIIGHCGLLKLRPTDIAKNIEQIERAAERAAELCNLMLAYAGKSRVLLTSCDMTRVLGDMISMLKATLPHNVVMETEFADDIPHIVADIIQIKQIVMNLIINAAEAIGDARGKIRVSLERTGFMDGNTDRDYLGSVIPAGDYICLTVTDNGSGMDEEIRSKIFEPFYSTKFTGRGLGMSATLGIISAHKGALQLESQPEQGTTFRIYLPADAAQ